MYKDLAGHSGDALTLQTWHLPESVQFQVADWFAGRIKAGKTDGSRSVILPGPAKDVLGIKIKGAGYKGGEVRLGTPHRAGPRAPVFDYEGRMMEDVAAGHDNAPSGGASFQQAATEYHMSQLLTRLGYACVPCLGYGRITQAGLTSWFSVFSWTDDWQADLIFPQVSVEAWIIQNHAIGALLIELAIVHDLIGYASYVGLPDGGMLIKDLHPFRMADTINMSQISWVMQVYFGLHIRTNVLKSNALRYRDRGLPPDIHLALCKSFCPEVTQADHDVVRLNIVAPYMISPPAEFAPQRLLDTLHENAITRALLTLCPDRFSRY